MAVRILIDSASDIDKAEADEMGVDFIPMQIQFGDEEFLDGVNLSHREFYEKLIECDDLPKTSMINEFRYEECFEELTKNGDDVVAIVLSSKLSGSYNCAKEVAKKFKDKVYVVDSMNACLGERILCQYALRLLKEGKSAKEIVEILDEKKSKICVLGLLGTLKYLKKGGRISSTTAFVGEVMSIKPVVQVIDGKVKMVGKAVGSKKGNNLLVQCINNNGGIDFSMPYATAYTGFSDEVLKKYLEDSKALWEGKTDNVPIYVVGSTIGTHIGPGAIAVAFFAN
ncbi:MAG: DegV family protein [Clostridia bacterium]|nr:DegV family protein [Clostridia bacterium]